MARKRRPAPGGARSRSASRATPATRAAAGKAGKAGKAGSGGRARTVGRAHKVGRVGTAAGRAARPTARRQSSTTVRRDRFLVVGTAVLSAGILAVGLPVRSLLADHQAVAAAAASLHQVHQENRQLSVEQQQLASNAELARLARKEYQLVLPGQHLYDVLPLAGSRPDGSPASAAAGDPGLGAPVAPSDSPTLHPDPGLTGTSPPSSSTGSAPGGALGGPPGGGSSSRPPGFWRRVADTLEFWR